MPAASLWQFRLSGSVVELQTPQHAHTLATEHRSWFSQVPSRLARSVSFKQPIPDSGISDAVLTLPHTWLPLLLSGQWRSFLLPAGRCKAPTLVRSLVLRSKLDMLGKQWIRAVFPDGFNWHPASSD
eukprot:8939869-Alexandrium_andersonii.AAC.1